MSNEMDKYVENWLTGLSERTKTNYLTEIEKWQTFIGMTPTEQINKRLQDLTSQDLTERTYFEGKFRAYKEFLEKEGKLSALSIKTMLRTVASFFSRNGLTLNLKRGDWQSTLETKVIHKFKLSKEDVKAMYQHANLRDRALLLVLSQSGFSEIDVSELKIEDIQNLYSMPQTEHYFIEKPREKTNTIQATCISYEALHDIRAMLAERGNPQEGFIFISGTYGQGSQMTTRTINEAMKNLAERTFDTEKAKQFQTKALRSFYNSALLRANPTQEIKDVMMGHARLSARKHYSYDDVTIKENYQSAFEHLSINGIQSREDLAELKTAFNTTKTQLAQLITELSERNAKLEAKLESMGVDIHDIKKTIPDMQNDILEIQKKTNIKPKPIKEYT
jgi:site-specific recombinase XerD